jgi:rhodanese-related sulfurtransferase
MSREEFVTLMTTDFPAAPKYFARDAEINRRGARLLEEVTASPLARENIVPGALFLDVRDAAAFGASHIRGAINIGLGGQFASWCGTLLPIDVPIVIAADSTEHANEAVMRLARVGIESAAGYITDDEGFAHASIPQISVQELHGRDLPVLDVRRKGEYAKGHVPGALHIPLDELPRRLHEVRGDVAVICASGYRSSIASSLLQRDGVADGMNVAGGTAGWIRAGYRVE